MNKISIITSSFLLIISIIACKPVAPPVISSPPSIAGYDTTDYNIIFNDALRQKMLGNHIDAARLFTRALKINSNSDASHYELSLLYQAAGESQNAIRHAAMAANLDSKNSWYQNNAGIQYYISGRRDSAIFYFARLVNLEPEREDHKISLAGLYEENRDFEKAESIVLQFIDKYGAEEQLLVSLVRIYTSWGKTDLAEKAILKLIESGENIVSAYGMLADFYKNQQREEDAIRAYEKLFELDPENLQLQISYLDFLRVSGKYDLFISGLNNIVFNDSIPVDGKKGLFGGVLNDSRILKERADDLELPTMLFASNYQDVPDVVLLVAQIFEACNKDERVISTLRDYCERNPDDYFMWERLLFAYSSQENVSDLYNTAKYVATKFNLYPLPKLLLAFAANEKGEYDLALSELDKALMLAGNQEELILEISSLLASVYYHKGEFDKAFKTYSKALELSPDNAVLLNNYAYYLSEQGLRLKEALSMIEKCLALESNSTYLDTYAWVLYKLKKYKKANIVMEVLYQSKTMESAEHFEHYGFIKRALRDCDGAVMLWKEAMRMDISKTHLEKEIKECEQGL